MKCAARLGLILVAVVPFSTSVYAKTATAERFDAIVRVLPGGTLDVTETLVFRFEDGPFRDLVRELPRRRIDGLEIRELWMDDRRIGIGDAAGQARIEGSFRNRIRWRFAPISSSTHTFRVRYVVRGAVREDDRGDRLTWMARRRGRAVRRRADPRVRPLAGLRQAEARISAGRACRVVPGFAARAARRGCRERKALARTCGRCAPSACRAGSHPRVAEPRRVRIAHLPAIGRNA